MKRADDENVKVQRGLFAHRKILRDWSSLGIAYMHVHTYIYIFVQARVIVHGVLCKMLYESARSIPIAAKQRRILEYPALNSSNRAIICSLDSLAPAVDTMGETEIRFLILSRIGNRNFVPYTRGIPRMYRAARDSRIHRFVRLIR